MFEILILEKQAAIFKRQGVLYVLGQAKLNFGHKNDYNPKCFAMCATKVLGYEYSTVELKLFKLSATNLKLL